MSWTKRRTERETLAFLERVTLQCMDLGGPISKEIGSMALDHRYADVIDYHFDYGNISVNDAIYARQIQALYSKSEFINLGVDKEALAFDLFMQMEQRCKETNERFRNGQPNGCVASVLHGAQRKISAILGLVPSLEAFDFAFGPGATTGVKMAEACFRSKLSAKLECSYEFSLRAGDYLQELPWLVAHHDRKLLGQDVESFMEADTPMSVTLNIAHGRLSFVPKNSRIKRSIVVEPTLNGFFQKGVGSYIRDRLRKFGVDLRCQSRNRTLAKEGSITDSLATIDLRSASDTISYGLILDLLPYEWFELLSDLRTGSVVYRGQVIPLEKFSSMGNGFTFELESLIFYALSVAACDFLSIETKDVSVYGDDIIIPSSAAQLLSEVLAYCGFEVNNSKSYASGPFRESCGADWLHGIDIRPFYWRELLSERYLYLFHNWAVRHREVELISLALSWTNETMRLYGPDGYGDGHLIGSYSLRQNREMRRRGFSGGYFDTYSLRPRVFTKPLPGDWLVPLYSVYTRSGALDPTDPNIVRGSRGYAKVSIYTLRSSVF